MPVTLDVLDGPLWSVYSSADPQPVVLFAAPAAVLGLLEETEMLHLEPSHEVRQPVIGGIELLVGMNKENPRVFEASHRLILRPVGTTQEVVWERIR